MKGLLPLLLVTLASFQLATALVIPENAAHEGFSENKVGPMIAMTLCSVYL